MMTINNLFKVALETLVIVIVQVTFLNHVQLFHLATPLLYVYVILKFPLRNNLAQYLFGSFVLGLVMDMFSNTPGMHAAACTLTTFVRYYLLRRIADSDLDDNAIPSFKILGTLSFIRYSLTLISLHHVCLLLLESFTLFDPLFLLLRISTCIIATFALVIIVEALKSSK